MQKLLMHVCVCVALAAVVAACGGDDGSTQEECPAGTVDPDGDGVCETACPDADEDGVCDADDVCATGDDSADADGDGVPDACDVCAEGDDGVDADGNGVPDACDGCPDADGDGVCDADDICAEGDDAADRDGDLTPDACDACPDDINNDIDGDGVCDSEDTCPQDNPDDSDEDGVCDSDDPCPQDNPDDSDGDGVCDTDDACADFPDTEDVDDDGTPDACDVCPNDPSDDQDGDGVCDSDDRCQGAFDSQVIGFVICPARSCLDILESREVAPEDGVYYIDPASTGESIEVRCDMTTDGGGWTRVFYHDAAGGYFTDATDAALRTTDGASASLFSILTHLGVFHPEGSLATYRIHYPDEALGNTWVQATNPMTDVSVAGYVPVDLQLTANFWSGLELGNGSHGPVNNDNSLLDGSVNASNWNYGIGTYAPWGTLGLPAADVIGGDGSAARVELWVREGPDVACGDGVVHTPWESCDDGNTDAEDGCSDTCLLETGLAHCQDIVVEGQSVGDAVYLISPRGASRDFPALCDMDDAGGGWTLILNQDQTGPVFADLTAARANDLLDPLSGLYSQVESIGRYWGEDSATFRIEWPGREAENVWIQTSNPAADVDVAGYFPLSIDVATNDWGGLELGNGSHGPVNSNSSLIDGSVNVTSWWYAIGATQRYSTHGIPGASDLGYGGSVPHVRLWMRPGPDCGDGFTMMPLESCDDGNLTDGDGCSSTCTVETGQDSCAAILADGQSYGDGLYQITLSSGPVDVQCDMTTEDGGWTLLARNTETRSFTFFSRNWAEYKAGFGDLRAVGMGWVGNDTIAELTGSGVTLQVRSDVQPHTYEGFRVADEGFNYQMTFDPETSTEANDGGLFANHIGAEFTTYDRDNDVWAGNGTTANCAELYRAGWWYNQCYHMSLAGSSSSQVYWRNAAGSTEYVEWIELWVR